MVTQQISKYQLDVLKGLGLPEVKENNQWLVLHVRGDGIRAPVSWNAKVYTNSAGSMKVVTTDTAALLALLGGGSQVQALQVPPSAPGSSRVISIDDSGWGCETDDAEVLTKRGWLSCYELKEDDFVLSYSDDGTIRWSPILNIDIHHYNGKINQFKHRRMMIRITPDHHMKVLRRVFKGNAVKHTSKLVGFRVEYIHSSNLRSNDRIPLTGRWIGVDSEYFVLPSIEQIKHDSSPRGSIKIKMDDWLSFFGLWLAEGDTWAGKRGMGRSNYRVNLYQNAGSETIGRIRDILLKLPFGFSETSRRRNRPNTESEARVFTIRNKQLYVYLKQFGNTYEKYVPRDILDLPPERLRVLIEHMFYGDGNLCFTHNGRSSHQRYYTSSPKLRDCLQEMIVKTGRSFTTRVKNSKMNTCDNFDISMNITKWCVVGNTEHTTLHYEGNVFDLSVVDDRSFLVRRDGKSYFTGNCPVGGVLFGVHDSLTGKILTTEVRVEFFQSPRFERKEYLEQAAVQVAPLLDDLGAADEAGVVYKICTGYVNNGIDLMLRKHLYKGGGCRVVREAIGEPLQSALEKAHAEYVQKLTGGASLYYDPKELTGSAIRRAYSDAMRWIREHNAWDIAKTGWKPMKACSGRD